MEGNVYLKDQSGNPLGTATNPLHVYYDAQIGATTLNGLSDVIITLPVEGEVLTYDATGVWKNGEGFSGYSSISGYATISGFASNAALLGGASSDTFAAAGHNHNHNDLDNIDGGTYHLDITAYGSVNGWDVAPLVHSHTYVDVSGYATICGVASNAALLGGASSDTFAAAAHTHAHNDTTSLQGGASGEYYHSTLSEYTGTGTGVFVRQYSPQIKSGLGIGVDPSYLLHIKGTSTTDLPTYSAEFLDAANWTGTGTATNWTGSFATGFTHLAGNTATLSHDHTAVNATKYQIAYTVSGRTAGTFTITFGGQTSIAISATGAWGPTSTGTGVLQITPTSTFDGTIIISIKSITAISTPVQVFIDSSGNTINEIRVGNINTNIFIGYESGGYNTTGNRNIGIGFQTLYNTTTGYHNVGIGYWVLKTNTTGYMNVGFGAGALLSNTTGYLNSAMGTSALQLNTTGYENVGIGTSPLYNNTTGYKNVAIGPSASFTNTEGYHNTSVGQWALYSNQTGYKNTAVGYYSLYGVTGIGNSGLGNGVLYNITTGTYNTGLGYNAGNNVNQKVDATNSMGLGANTFTNRSNQVVVGDASVVETQLRTGVYIGSTSTTAHTQPTARLHIAAGAAGAGTAPIKLTAGTVNTSPEAGAIEFDGTDFYVSI